MVTGAQPHETVWWAEHRANARGYNDTRVIMCERGRSPMCVRIAVEDIELRRAEPAE